MTNETLEPQALEAETPESETIIDVLRGIQAELKQLNATLKTISGPGVSGVQGPRFPGNRPSGSAPARGERAEGTSFDSPKPKRTSPKKRAKVKGKLPAKKGGGYPKNPR